LLIYLQTHAQIHIIDKSAFKSLHPFQDNVNTLSYLVFVTMLQKTLVRRKKTHYFGSNYFQNILAIFCICLSLIGHWDCTNSVIQMWKVLLPRSCIQTPVCAKVFYSDEKSITSKLKLTAS